MFGLELQFLEMLYWRVWGDGKDQGQQGDHWGSMDCADGVEKPAGVKVMR